MQRLSRLFVGAGLSLLLSGCSHQRKVPITRLPDDTAGRCLDGSPAAFYFDPAVTEPHKKKWVLWLEGGGECVAESNCRHRSTTGAGSSTSYPSNMGVDKMPFFASANAEETPATAEWNRVLLKYCSGDVWSGTRTQTTPETFGLYFSGHLVLQAVVEQLQARGLDSAETVVFGGDSAGGIGMWLNVGWLRDALPNTEVIAASVAGWYSFSYQYTGPGSKTGFWPDFGADAWPAYVELWQSHMDADCVAALAPDSSRCMLANFSRPHIRAVRAFVTEAQTDKVQIGAHDSVPGTHFNSDELLYIRAWKDNMTDMLNSQLNPDDGFFSPACYIHEEFKAQVPLLPDNNGRLVNYGQAFAQWLRNSTNSTVRYEDSCGIFCGHCHGVSSQLLLAI